MKTVSAPCDYETFLIGALAGAAGGVAEILWLGLYGAVSGNDIAELARSIVTVVGVILPVSPSLSASIASGLAIHMLAAVALGIVLAFALRALSLRNLVRGQEYRFLPAALAIIWVFNFFVLLPLISPYFADLHRSFTEIVPYPVSLLSKLLFGLAAAIVLTRARKTRDQPVFIRV
jgi:hypothetical protein